MAQFEHALKSLIEDPPVSRRRGRRPDSSHFNELNAQELLLMQVWNATGHERASLAAIALCQCCCGE